MHAENTLPERCTSRRARNGSQTVGRRQSIGFIVERTALKSCTANTLLGRRPGQKRSSCGYVNGQKEGVFLWWDDDGKLADAVEYIDGKPRAIVEWEARDQRAVKTAIYLYPYILVRPDGGLTFSSSYAEITKEFSISQIDEVFASLPASVWVEGKSIGVQQINIASEADHQTMDQVTEKLTAFFSGKGYRVRRLPQ